jgi:hypothetical protein
LVLLLAQIFKIHNLQNWKKSDKHKNRIMNTKSEKVNFANILLMLK